MSATDALRAARAAGIDLSIDKDDLVLEAASEPAPAILGMLRKHKACIIKLLRPELRLNGDSLSGKDWHVFFNERVEIAECQAGMSRPEAEARAFAWCLVEWLNRNPMRSPLGHCFGCGGNGYDGSHNPLLPFDVGGAGEDWLHSGCGPAWDAGRKAEAIAALAEMGVVAPYLPDDFGACRNTVEGLWLIQSDQPTINSVSSVTESESVGAQEPRPSANPPRPSVNRTVDAVDTVGLVDDPEERAALIEESAGVPRAWAKGYAALCAMPPPTGFSLGRWQRVVDATGVFLDRWANTATACGWSDLEVFGCDGTAPDRRFDCMGLVLLLHRCEVVAVDEDGADLVTNTGAKQRFRRRQLPPNTITLWELAR